VVRSHSYLTYRLNTLPADLSSAHVLRFHRNSRANLLIFSVVLVILSAVCVQHFGFHTEGACSTFTLNALSQVWTRRKKSQRKISVKTPIERNSRSVLVLLALGTLPQSLLHRGWRFNLLRRPTNESPASLDDGNRQGKKFSCKLTRPSARHSAHDGGTRDESFLHSSGNQASDAHRIFDGLTFTRVIPECWCKAAICSHRRGTP